MKPITVKREGLLLEELDEKEEEKDEDEKEDEKKEAGSAQS